MAPLPSCFSMRKGPICFPSSMVHRGRAEQRSYRKGHSEALATGFLALSRHRMMTKEVAMALLFTDPLFLEHDTGRHVETADRLRSITARLDKAGLVKKCTAGTYKPLTEEAVAKLHAAKQIQSIKQLAEHGGGRIDPDTVVRAKS